MTQPKYLYALFNDGVRMSGSNYGKLFFERSTARAWKLKAAKSSKVNGSVSIGRLAVNDQWEMVH